MIFHFYSDYQPKDEGAIRRMMVAAFTWPKQPWCEVPIKDSSLTNIWTDGSRSIPYIRDLFNTVVSVSRDPEDICVFTNSDICVRTDACLKIAAAMQGTDALYGGRRDFSHDFTQPIPDADIIKGFDYAGNDLFAFRSEWWREFRSFFPNMLLGFEAWDAVMSHLIDETNPVGCNRVSNIAYHQKHGGPTHWENALNRYRSRGQIYNLGLAKQFFLQRGISPAKYGIR